MKYLSNGILEISVSEMGAELQSLRRVASPREYLWQGDGTYWDRRSPILFPIVGKVWNNTLRIDEKTFTLTQHGFARDMPFSCDVEEDRHLSFSMLYTPSDDSTLWPHPFKLSIDYTLLRNVLTVAFTVYNLGQSPMLFQLGAHPGFNYPRYSPTDNIHGFLSFDASTPLQSTAIAPGGYADTKTFDIEIPQDGLLPLTNESFLCDTILESTGRIHRVTLHDKDGRPIITVKHAMPITAIWSPCGGQAPFVCIEPWHGCCDPVGFDLDIRHKPFVDQVLPTSTWQTQYQIIVE